MVHKLLLRGIINKSQHALAMVARLVEEIGCGVSCCGSTTRNAADSVQVEG
jgi:hypothetical protein